MPSSRAQDAIPMVSKLTYSERYTKALRYIFGRTLICRNLEVATNLARSTKLDCVTLDGDQVRYRTPVQRCGDTKILTDADTSFNLLKYFIQI